jgi:hypothetical protein
MISEEKIQEVKRWLRKGEPEGEIKERLRKEGYAEDDINKAFVPHKYDMRSWYLYFAIIIAIAGIFVLINNGGFLILVLSGLLFGAYFREIERVKKQ